jgi:hypothetical protein
MTGPVEMKFCGARSILLPLREKVAAKGRRMRGLSEQSVGHRMEAERAFDPSSVSFADTFSRKGRRIAYGRQICMPGFGEGP